MTIRLVIYRQLSRSLKAIRNVGIIAHIDAGKTTTTERMLFNCGKIKMVGEVDHGTTMTDYLDQERERGISITSAVATMTWKEHDINLIDTPGHVDFTLEVERALTILDGAITVLDAAKGVEAQTQTVWNQASSHDIPNIFFINKFDKKNANFTLCLKSISQRLPNTVPLLINLPYYCSDSGHFMGIVDIINLQLEFWDITNKSSKGMLTESYTRKINDSEDIFKSCIKARRRLLESLTDLDDGPIRESYLVLDNPEILIPPQMIIDAIRKATISAKASPVIIGSSKMNIGVTNILNKIVAYLPDPSEKMASSKLSNLAAHPDYVTALAFKVIHDKYKGPLTFLRIYSGVLEPAQLIRNLSRSVNEKIENIIQITGDHFVELKSSSAGNIVAVSGLNQCYTGDLLIDSKMPHVPEDGAYSNLITIPTPVIYASIEASGLSEIKNLEKALAELSKEDPSLKVQRDEETHQLIIGGMGQLHLEIIFDRIVKDYKLPNTRLGKVRIAYKECPIDECDYDFFHDFSITEKMQGYNIKVSMMLSAGAHKDFIKKSEVDFVHSKEFRWSTVDPKVMQIIKDGIIKAIDNGGPLLHSPVTGLKIMVHNFIVEPNDVTLSNKANQLFLRSCAVEAFRGLMKRIPTNLLEPMMKVEISFHNSGSLLQYYVSNVMNDMHRRRSKIVTRDIINSDLDSDCLIAFIPLAETGDYSNTLRAITSGNASMHMCFSHYDIMAKTAQENVTKKIIYRS